MTSEELRARSREHREAADGAAKKHVEASFRLAKDLTQAERIATEAEASVYDCMARRHRQWANHYAAAADDVDECP